MDIEESKSLKGPKKKPMLSVKTRFINAFFEILESKHFEKISVSEICSEADLSRQTFYTIFSNKEDVVRSYYLSFLSDLHKSMDKFEGDFHARFSQIVETLLNDSRLRMLYKYSSLQGLLENSLKDHLDAVFLSKYSDLTQERVILHIIASSICSSLIFNFSNGKINLSCHQIVSLYQNLLKESMVEKLINYN